MASTDNAPMLLDPSQIAARFSTIRVGDTAMDGVTLLDRAAAHLDALRERGIAEGARVAVWATPTLETVIAVTAHALGGVVTVPMNPSVGVTERAHILRDASPAALVGDVGEVVIDEVPTMRVPHGVIPRAAQRWVAREDHDPAMVLYTSGTTGLPKGAVLTVGNLASNLDALARAWAWTRDDTLVHALPMFHVHGLALGVLGPLRHGCALRMLPRFDAADLAGALGDGGTMLFAVPTMYHRLAERAERDASVARCLAQARLLVSGSAPLPLREHRRIEAATGRGVRERYGLTETLINTAVRAGDAGLVGSVGPALDGVSVRLVDDARRDLADDDATPGEVAVRGPNVFAGYLNQPEKTAAVRDDDGWFYTGDIATRDATGALRIVGRRATDLIKTGGFKVGAGEVEGALLEHPAVAEAAVRGVVDDDLGERIVAWVVLHPGSSARGEELTEHVAASLSKHKRPRSVHVVDALPRNAMGKVLKRNLTEGAR